MTKRILAIMCIASLVLLVGCGSKEAPLPSPSDDETSFTSDEETTFPTDNENIFPSDDEIIENMAPYLDSTEEQDVSTDEWLKANLGLTSADVTDSRYIIGMPYQNTTNFFMGTFTEDADIEKITAQLEDVMKNWVDSCERGYSEGFTEYKIIVKQDKIFAIMNKDQENLDLMSQYLNSLPD